MQQEWGEKSGREYADLIDAIAEMLMEVFDVDSGIVGSKETTDMFHADRQTHCAALQPV
jgi:hypothetical protein